MDLPSEINDANCSPGVTSGDCDAPALPQVRVAASVSRRLLTTKEAAEYCGFKTAGAIRKLLLEGRLKPVGKRGGRGTWMFDRADLDAFLGGAGSGSLAEDRQRAPQANEAPHDRHDTVQKNEVRKRVQYTNRRSLRTGAGHGPDHGQARADQEDPAD